MGMLFSLTQTSSGFDLKSTELQQQVTLHNDESNWSWKSKMFRKVSSKVERATDDPSPNALGLTMRGSSEERSVV